MVASETRVILVTSPDEPSATRLCRTLVEEGLIACGTIVPGVRSVYRWEGSLRDEPEVLLLIKTVATRVPAILRRVPELHPYEVPEVLALTVDSGYPPYLDWVSRETRGAG